MGEREYDAPAIVATMQRNYRGGVSRTGYCGWWATPAKYVSIVMLAASELIHGAVRPAARRGDTWR